MIAGIEKESAPGAEGRAMPASRRPAVSVVIPAYNEQGAVRTTVLAVRHALDGAGVAHEIVVVNDGSTDGTADEVSGSGARLIDFPENIGYGHALKAGIAAGDSELVAILDADGTYPPDALPAMIRMAAHSDMVVGDRGAAMNNVPWVRRPAKWILKLLASVVAQRRINDVNSGLRVFRRTALEQFIPLLPDGYSFTTTITLCMLATNLTVVYLPINYGRRIGRSKIRARHFFKFLFLVIRLTVFFQPLRIFLPLGAVLFVGGVAKAIHDRDLSPVSIYAMISAILVWSLGLLADMITRLHFRRRGSGERDGAARW
ncbi:MAG: glycosyltransferase family 2 protein [Betaproteobacteria bacterium]